MNYDIQQALRDKANNWQVQELERQINSLKNDLHNMQEEKVRRDNLTGNLRYAIDRLLNILTECGIKELEDYQGELNQLNNF